MKKFFVLTLMLVGFAVAKPLTFEICTPTFCYDQTIHDAKSWQWMADFNGRKFVRVYLYGNHILDIDGHGKTIKPKK